MTETKKQATILIVDDVASNIQILMTTLTDQYAIVAAKNGEKALRIAEAEPPPDLILLDVVMPDIDGYEVCKRLKNHPKTQNIPIIFVTALDEASDETKGLELGAIDYIHKPFNQAIVRARVRNHLELIRARNQLQTQNQALIEAAALREDVERITRHDLKSPLNAVINYPQLLLRNTELSEKHQHYLHRVIESGYLMLEQINRSLDLYKMETGSYTFNPQVVDLLPIIQRVADENHKSFPAHRVEISLTDNAEFLWVKAEALLCYSMLTNLVKNALEASPADKPVIISAQLETSCCLVQIHNHGAVPQAIRERFFDKYVTANKATGTGLGTYSAALIAKAQNGEIKLDCSQIDKTLISVRLPRAAPPEENLFANAIGSGEYENLESDLS